MRLAKNELKDQNTKANRNVISKKNIIPCQKPIG